MQNKKWHTPWATLYYLYILYCEKNHMNSLSTAIGPKIRIYNNQVQTLSNQIQIELNFMKATIFSQPYLQFRNNFFSHPWILMGLHLAIGVRVAMLNIPGLPEARIVAIGHVGHSTKVGVHGSHTLKHCSDSKTENKVCILNVILRS